MKVDNNIKTKAIECVKEIETHTRRFGVKGRKNLESDCMEKSTLTIKNFWNRFLPKSLQKYSRVTFYPNSKVKQSEEIIQNGIRIKYSEFKPDGVVKLVETFNPKTNRYHKINYQGNRPEELVKYGDVVHYHSRPGENGGWFEETYEPELHKRTKTLTETLRFSEYSDQKCTIVTKRRIDYDNGNYEFHTYAPEYHNTNKTSTYYDKNTRSKTTVTYNKQWGYRDRLLLENFDENGKVIKAKKLIPYRDGQFNLYEKEVDKLTGNVIEKQYYPREIGNWLKNPIEKVTVKDKDGKIIKEIRYDENGKIISTKNENPQNVKNNNSSSKEVALKD